MGIELIAQKGKKSGQQEIAQQDENSLLHVE
jgi:hypothetical protein